MNGKGREQLEQTHLRILEDRYVFLFFSYFIPGCSFLSCSLYGNSGLEDKITWEDVLVMVMVQQHYIHFCVYTMTTLFFSHDGLDHHRYTESMLSPC